MPYRNSLSVLAALMLGPAATLSCGSAAAATEVRPIGGFNSIELDGNAALDVQLGGRSEIVIDANDALLPHIITDVENRRLIIHQDPTGWFGAWNKVTVHVTLPELDAVQLNGAGSGTLTNLQGSAIALLLTGSGHVTATGSVDQLALDIKGSGSADLSGLDTGRAEVIVDGSGGARLKARTALTVTIAGSGNVAYAGQPEVSSSITGSGRLVGLDAKPAEH